MALSLLSPSVDRGVNDGFKFNRETEFVPIAGLVEKELNEGKDKVEKKTSGATNIYNNHYPAVLSVLRLAEELSVEGRGQKRRASWKRLNSLRCS